MTAGGHGFDGVERRGLMFVLSSPSGAGKTTLSRLLIERMPGLRMSVSATTRPMRPGEVEGHAAIAGKGAGGRCQRFHPAAVRRRPGKTLALPRAGFRSGHPGTDEPR